MAIFRVKVAGHEAPLLVKAKGLREAKDRIITQCDPLTADEMEAALTSGETVWREGESFPATAASVSADELEFLRFFYDQADFGPGDDDVRDAMSEAFTKKTGKPLPSGYGDEE